MTARTIVGVILIVLGIVGVTYGGFSFTQKDKVVDLGPLEVTKNERQTVPVPPIVGGVLLVAGIGLLFMRGQHA